MGGLIDDEEGGFRVGKGCVDQILTLKQIGEKNGRKNVKYVGFMNFEKPYDRVNREALWRMLRMYDVDGKLLNGIKKKNIYIC